MSETRRLYYEDVYRTEFEAEVTACEETQKGYAVTLNQTAFYPEGGGQPCDLGVLTVEEEKIEVKDVQEADREILHYVEKRMEPGTKVHGKIDWARRFDLMQQHSGEHIISGLIHEKYGYNNVGFHMSDDVITVDFSGVLTEEELKEIEDKANEVIWKNREVQISYPSPQELTRLDYRSKKELTGQVRIVTFPEADVCACCGTHVTHTGEIGMVRFLSVENFHEGVRVTMISGKRVSDYLHMVSGQNKKISVRLSSKIDQTASAVERLQEENQKLKAQIRQFEDALCMAEAQRWAGAGSVLLFQEGLETDTVRKMADAVMQKCGGCCAVFSKNEDGSYKYAMGESGGDLRNYTKEMNAALNGRGGGKPFFVQGSVKASEEEIRRFFER